MIGTKEIFGKRLKTLRETIPASQDEFAKRIGITRQSLSLYEKGQRAPDIEVLYTIHEKTGCSVRYLLGLQDYMSDEINKTAPLNATISELAMHSLIWAEPPMSSVINFLCYQEEFWQLLKSIAVISSGEQARHFDSPCFTSGYFDFVCHSLLDNIIALAKKNGENALSDSEREDIALRQQEYEFSRNAELYRIYENTEYASYEDTPETIELANERHNLYLDIRGNDKFSKFRASMLFPDINDH